MLRALVGLCGFGLRSLASAPADSAAQHRSASLWHGTLRANKFCTRFGPIEFKNESCKYLERDEFEHRSMPTDIAAVILGASEWPYSPQFLRSGAFKSASEELTSYLLD